MVLSSVAWRDGRAVVWRDAAPAVLQAQHAVVEAFGGPCVDPERAPGHRGGCECIGELAVALPGGGRRHRLPGKVHQLGKLHQVALTGTRDTNHRDVLALLLGRPVVAPADFEQALAEATIVDHHRVRSSRKLAQGRREIEIAEHFALRQRPGLRRSRAAGADPVTGEHDDDQVVGPSKLRQGPERVREQMSGGLSVKSHDLGMFGTESSADVALDDGKRAHRAGRRLALLAGVIACNQNRTNVSWRDLGNGGRVNRDIVNECQGEVSDGIDCMDGMDGIDCMDGMHVSSLPWFLLRVMITTVL
jgi:hypothetical protein